jgi:hypothetical protein
MIFNTQPALLRHRSGAKLIGRATSRRRNLVRGPLPPLALKLSDATLAMFRNTIATTEKT